MESQAGCAFIKENKTGEQKGLLKMSIIWKSDSCSVRDKDKRKPNVAPEPNIQQSNCWNKEMDGPGISWGSPSLRLQAPPWRQERAMARLGLWAAGGVWIQASEGDLGEQDGWAGPCGQGYCGARLGHQLGRGHIQVVSGLEMCPLAFLGQGLTAPGAGMPSCTMARRSICFQTVSQVLRT